MLLQLPVPILSRLPSSCGNHAAHAHQMRIGRPKTCCWGSRWHPSPVPRMVVIQRRQPSERSCSRDQPSLRRQYCTFVSRICKKEAQHDRTLSPELGFWGRRSPASGGHGTLGAKTGWGKWGNMAPAAFGKLSWFLLSAFEKSSPVLISRARYAPPIHSTCSALYMPHRRGEHMIDFRDVMRLRQKAVFGVAVNSKRVY